MTQGNRRILRSALITLCILLIPAFGNIYVDGWNWSPFDFVLMGGIIFGCTLVYELISRRLPKTMFKFAIGIGVITGFLVFWVNAAAQIIGSENPANMLYPAEILIGLIALIFARFQPRKLSRVAFMLAIIQMIIPTIAAIFWPSDFAPGVPQVFFLNSVFAMMFVASGLLFLQASSGEAKKTHPPLE